MSTATTSTKPAMRAPLPLSETLRDLALLRASDVDLSGPLAQALKRSSAASSTAQSGETPKSAEVEASVDRSYEFAREARKAVRMLHRGAVDEQGARVEEVRAKLEELTRGLDGSTT
jgi:hypothetical protein